MNKTLLLFQSANTAISMFSNTGIANAAKEQIDAVLEYNLEKARSNTDARLDAMETTFLYELRDANNKYVEQTTNLMAQSNDARSQSLSNMVDSSTKMVNSSYHQDIQNQIDDEYASTVNQLGMGFDESYKRMEMMGREKIKQTLSRGMEQQLQLQENAYTQKAQLASQQKVSNIKNIGKLGTLGIALYNDYSKSPTSNLNNIPKQSYDYSLDLDLF